MDNPQTLATSSTQDIGHTLSNQCMLEETERTITIRQSRDTGNSCTRHKTKIIEAKTQHSTVLQLYSRCDLYSLTMAIIWVYKNYWLSLETIIVLILQYRCYPNYVTEYDTWCHIHSFYISIIFIIHKYHIINY